jgi:hypothetical protein
MKSIKLCLILLATIFALTMQSPDHYKNDNLPAFPEEMNQETFDMFLKFLGGDDDKPKEEEKKQGDDKDKPNVWDSLFKGFMDVTNNWKKITDAFHTGRSTEIMEKLKGEGFEKFSQDAQVQVTTGIKEEYFDRFTESLLKRIKVPEGRQDDIQGALEVARFADRQMWSAFNTLFNVDDGGNVKFASIIVNRNEKNGKDVYDFVFTDLKSTFKLAPDVTVVNKKLVVLGGLWSDNEIVYEKTPKSFKPEDIEVIMNFFQIVTFKCFANHFGVKLEFPKL